MNDYHSIKKIRENEKKALFFMEFKNLESAEKALLDNIKLNTESVLTYDLMIKIYHQKNDLSSLLGLLNSGIQNTGKKNFYRKLKKQIILFRFLNDLDAPDA
jgi:hypothetical protein